MDMGVCLLMGLQLVGRRGHKPDAPAKDTVSFAGASGLCGDIAMSLFVLVLRGPYPTLWYFRNSGGTGGDLPGGGPWRKLASGLP